MKNTKTGTEKIRPYRLQTSSILSLSALFLRGLSTVPMFILCMYPLAVFQTPEIRFHHIL